MRSRLDLPALVRQTPRRRRATIVLRPVEASDTLIGDARAIGLKIVEGWRQASIRLLNTYDAIRANAHDGGVLDALSDNLSAQMASEAENLSRLVLQADAELDRWTLKVEEWQRKRFIGVVKIGTGVDLMPFLSAPDVQNQVAAALERHASLISNLNDDLRKRVSETIWREYLKETPRREIGRMLNDEIGVGRSRANLIAKDQTLKLSGELEKQRQTQVGIERYVWRTAMDERVRPTHAAREGQIYRWDDDSQIKPREEINCRCTGQAYLEILEQVDEDGNVILTPEGQQPTGGVVLPNMPVRQPGFEAEAHAVNAETNALNAETARAAQLNQAQAATAMVERALATAERLAQRAVALQAKAEAIAASEQLAQRAVQQAHAKAAAEAAENAKKQVTFAKAAAKKAQNAVAKLKAMQGSSAEIDALAEAAVKAIEQDPGSAYATLTKAQKAIAKAAEKAVFAKDEWLKKYIAGLEKLKAEATGPSKPSLQLEIDKATAELSKLAPGVPASTVEEALAKIEPAKGPIPPAEAHGGNFSQAIGMEGKFLETYGFSSKVLGLANAEAPVQQLLTQPAWVVENYGKLQKAFKEWKATGKLPAPGEIVPAKPPPPPGMRDPALGDILSGETKAMKAPVSTSGWTPLAKSEALAVQDVGDTAYQQTAQRASSLSAEHDSAWHSYKGIGYSSWNANLRKAGSETTSARTKRLDEVVQTFELPNDMLLYRGTGYVEGWDSAQAVLDATVFVDKGFLSTTVERSTAEGFSGGSSKAGAPIIRFAIRAKKGMRVGAGTDGEKEFIWPRGTKWRILDVAIKPGSLGRSIAEVLIEPW